MSTATAQDMIASLRASHDRLAALVGHLDEAQVKARSYDTEWTIAQVLSHLGSGAEIFTLLLEAGLAGTPAPGVEAFHPVWDVWNSRSALACRDESLLADDALIGLFEGLDAATVDAFAMSLFGTEVDLGAFVRMRLSEHAVHTWDIAVALDPQATVSSDVVDLMVDQLGALAARAGKGSSTSFRVRVGTSDPGRDLVVTVGEAVTIDPADPDDSYDGSVDLPAEAFVRLVHGRLDPDHTPEHTESGSRGLADLRTAFPGF